MRKNVGSLNGFLILGFALAIPLSVAAGPQPHDDNDTIPSFLDNCIFVTNESQCDTDQDGYGNACDADTNNDYVVGIVDFTTFVSEFQSSGPPGSIVSDFTCDGFVGVPDFTTYSNSFQGTPGPSGLSCAGTIPCN